MYFSSKNVLWLYIKYFTLVSVVWGKRSDRVQAQQTHTAHCIAKAVFVIIILVINRGKIYYRTFQEGPQDQAHTDPHV